MKHKTPSYAARVWMVLAACALLLASCTAPTPTPTAAPTATTVPAVASTATAVPTPVPTEPPSTALAAFDREIRINNPAAAVGTGWAATLVDAAPVDPNNSVYAAHPAYAQFKLSSYVNEKGMQLPFPLEGAQVMVYRIADFPTFAFEGARDYPREAQALSELLKGTPDFSFCDQVVSNKPALPFLPVVNSAQVFCALPQVIDLQNGRGVRYLTYYTQGMDPAIEALVFYTFQSIVADEYYVSAFFPVKTGVFPIDPDAAPPASPEAFQKGLNDQLAILKTQPAAAFQPLLADLDALVGSVRIQ